MSNKDNFDIKEYAGKHNVELCPMTKEDHGSFLSILAKAAGEVLLMPLRMSAMIYTGAIAGAFKAADLVTADRNKSGDIIHNSFIEGTKDLFMGFAKSNGKAAFFYAPNTLMQGIYHAAYDPKEGLTVLNKVPSPSIINATAYQSFAPSQTQGQSR